MDGKDLPKLFSLWHEFEMVKEGYKNNKHNKTNKQIQLCLITRQVLGFDMMVPIDSKAAGHHVANHNVPGYKLLVDQSVNGGCFVHSESVAVDSSVHSGWSERGESQFQNDMENIQHLELTDNNRQQSQPRNAQEMQTVQRCL